jgi:hypothetical protein
MLRDFGDQNGIGRELIAAESGLNARDFERVGDGGQMSGVEFDVYDRPDNLSDFSNLCHDCFPKIAQSPVPEETASTSISTRMSGAIQFGDFNHRSRRANFSKKLAVRATNGFPVRDIHDVYAGANHIF